MAWGDKVKTVLHSTVEAMGFEFVGHEYIPGKYHAILRIYIDNPAGVTIDDCAKVSRQVGSALDVADVMPGKYSLEVSSPGLNRALFEREHYEKQMGKMLRVRLHTAVEGHRRFKAILQGFDGDNVIFKMGDEELTVAFDNIRKANVISDL